MRRVNTAGCNSVVCRQAPDPRPQRKALIDLNAEEDHDPPPPRQSACSAVDINESWQRTLEPYPSRLPSQGPWLRCG
jgi:hypothetical protein